MYGKDEMDKTTANRVIDAALRDGGGTFTNTGAALVSQTGYAVGLYPGTWVKTHLVTLAAEIIVDMAVIFPDAFVGIWIDDRSTIHIDPVTIVPDLEYALDLARANEQVGIYDFAKGQTILL